jgi:hypothetical protein
MEAEMPVELSGPVVNGVNHHRSRAELTTAAHTTTESIDQEVPAKRVALFGAVDRQAGQDDDRYRIGQSPAQARGRALMGD